MLQFQKGDFVLVADGPCGREALNDAENGSSASFHLLDGVLLDNSNLQFAVLPANAPSQIGYQLSGPPGSRVFLAGDLPRPRIQNLQILGEDPLLFSILLGTLDTEAAPLGKAGIRALEEGCCSAGLVPTSLDEALVPGTIRYGDIGGIPLAESRKRELESHLGNLLAGGGEGVAFVSQGTLIEPTRPRPIKRQVEETHFLKGDDAALLWVPLRTCLFDVSIIDERLVEICTKQQIATIMLAGKDVIPAEIDALESTCKREGLTLHRSRIGD